MIPTPDSVFFNFINPVKTEKKKMIHEGVAQCYVRFLVAFFRF